MKTKILIIALLLLSGCITPAQNVYSSFKSNIQADSITAIYKVDSIKSKHREDSMTICLSNKLYDTIIDTILIKHNIWFREYIKNGETEYKNDAYLCYHHI